jgi:predicted FMN-binding regulatory protein PaiB
MRPARGKVVETPSNFVAAQMRDIIGMKVRLICIEGRWKMNQTAPSRLRRRARTFREAREPRGGDRGDR